MTIFSFSSRTVFDEAPNPPRQFQGRSGASAEVQIISVWQIQ